MGGIFTFAAVIYAEIRGVPNPKETVEGILSKSKYSCRVLDKQLAFDIMEEIDTIRDK